MNLVPIEDKQAFWGDVALKLCDKHAEPFEARYRYKHPDPQQDVCCGQFMCVDNWTHLVYLRPYPILYSSEIAEQFNLSPS